MLAVVLLGVELDAVVAFGMVTDDDYKAVRDNLDWAHDCQIGLVPHLRSPTRQSLCSLMNLINAALRSCPSRASVGSNPASGPVGVSSASSSTPGPLRSTLPARSQVEVCSVHGVLRAVEAVG